MSSRFSQVFRVFLVSQVFRVFLSAQPAPTPTTATLTVNKTTGAITAPVSAATFRSANGIGGGGTGDLLSTNNLSDVASAATTRANLQLAYAAADIAPASNIAGSRFPPVVREAAC